MDDFVRVNVGGTAAVLDAAPTPASARVVHVSSVVVYGYDDPGEQDETRVPPHLRDSLHRHEVGLRPARPRRGAGSCPAGRRLRPGLGAVDGAAAGDARAPGSSRFPAAGAARMLPVFVDDLVEALLLAAERGEPGARVHGVGGRAGELQRLLRRRIAEIAGGRRPAERCHARCSSSIGAAVETLGARCAVGRARASPPARRPSSTVAAPSRSSAVRWELGWEPRVPLARGCAVRPSGRTPSASSPIRMAPP